MAEQLVTVKNRRGYARQEWQKMRERNEALDTRVYARAAAWILGADRWDERMGRQLETQVGVEAPPEEPLTRSERPPEPSEPQAGRVHTQRRSGWRSYRSSYMD